MNRGWIKRCHEVRECLFFLLRTAGAAITCKKNFRNWRRTLLVLPVIWRGWRIWEVSVPPLVFPRRVRMSAVVESTGTDVLLF
jgi:hypothetical protein